MQRKPVYPVANCNIKMPEAIHPDAVPEDDGENHQRRLQLINFGHTQWGFNNWSWSVTKQELDFVELSSGKYTAGVVAFVSITVKSLDIHRENIGYATSVGSNKGYAIYKSRKCAVTNALRETLLSFGGTVAAELGELLETSRDHEPLPENNQNIPNQPLAPTIAPPKNLPECANRVKNAPQVPLVVPPMVPPVPPLVPPVPPLVPPPPRSAPPRARSNEGEGEDARAERKRRQRLAQEEFRLKQMMKGKADTEETPNVKGSTSNSIDNLLLEIPSQIVEIEKTGEERGKRKSPGSERDGKRRSRPEI